MCCHTTCTYRGSAGDETLPLAVIVDGNRRWKRLRGLGGRCESLREMQELCCKFGVLVLSLFASFSENCFHPKVLNWLMAFSSRVDFDKTGYSCPTWMASAR
ncbi:hypothetical protein SLE2022_074140 [Rubroshorea leprosula]